MQNFRYSNELHLNIAVDVGGQTLFVPVDPANRDYREIQRLVAKGEAVIAPYQPDPVGAEGAKRAKAQAKMLDALIAGGKPVEDILTEARAELTKATEIAGRE